MALRKLQDSAYQIELMLEDMEHYIEEAKRQQFNLETALDMVIDKADKQDVIDFLGGVVRYNIADLADYYSEISDYLESLLADLESL